MLEAVCRGVSDDGYRIFYRPVDIREDSVPGIHLPSGAVFREGVDGSIGRRAPRPARGRKRTASGCTRASRSRRCSRTCCATASREAAAPRAPRPARARGHRQPAARGDRGAQEHGGLPARAWRVENGGDGKPPKLSTEERCHLFASLAAIKGAEVMIIAADAYVSTPDVLWRVVDRLAKYAATGYLEAPSSASAARAGSSCVRAPRRASRRRARSRARVAHKALQVKNQAAACKPRRCSRSAANSIRLGACGAVAELCRVLEHCLGIAAVDGTCVLCGRAARVLAAVSCSRTPRRTGARCARRASRPSWRGCARVRPAAQKYRTRRA